MKSIPKMLTLDFWIWIANIYLLVHNALICSRAIAIAFTIWLKRWKHNIITAFRNRWLNVFQRSSPAEVVASKSGPVLPDNLLHALFPGCYDGQPYQHWPQAIFLTNVVRTWGRKGNRISHFLRNLFYSFWQSIQRKAFVSHNLDVKQTMEKQLMLPSLR